MKIQRKIDNDVFKDVVIKAKECFSDILSSTLNIYRLDDKEYERKQVLLDKAAQLSEIDRVLLYLYATEGATASARILGISREYMHALVRKIKQKLGM